MRNVGRDRTAREAARATAVEQGDEADEAFGGTNPRAASGARPEVPPNARAAAAARGHRFAAYPRCSTDQYAGGGRMTTTDRGFWILVAACTVHVVEEYVLDWRSWAASMSGLQPTWGRFWLVERGVSLPCLFGRVGGVEARP